MHNDNNDSDDKTVLESYAEAKKTSPRARLVCLDDMQLDDLRGLDIELSTGEETIGRDDSNSIQINFRKLSRKHARISWNNDGWDIEDRGSANGVFLNEERIERARLGDGDILLIGQIPFRFELLTVSRGAPVPDTGASFEGDGGTMYAQHVGVIRSLAAAQETEEASIEPGQATREEVSASAREQVADLRPTPDAGRSRGGAKRVLIFLGLAGAVAIGGYAYQGFREDRSTAELVHRFDTQISRFIEDYEGVGDRVSEQSPETEMGELRQMTAGVDLAMQDKPGELGLLDLRAKLLFLEFERQFGRLLDDGRVYEAEQLVERVRNELARYAAKNDQAKGEAIAQVGNLLDLANVVVTFERFKESYPDPSGASGVRPDEYTLGKMHEAKEALIEKKREGYQMLSVVYLRFQKLVSRIEEQNVRLLNRWNEMGKRTEPGRG